MTSLINELDENKYDITTIKKIYSSVNQNNMFLNKYTLLDVEDSKKKLYMYLSQKYPQENSSKIQSFVEGTSKSLINELFQMDNGEQRNTQMVGIQNVIHDPRKLNPKYFQETFRIINIDSMYRKNMWENNMNYESKTSTNMMIELNDTLDNVISLQLTDVCIPYTFYVIEKSHGNNYFYVQATTPNRDLEKIEIPSGNYTNESLIEEINGVLLNITGFNNQNALRFSLNDSTNKITLHNETTFDYNIVFYDHLEEHTESNTSSKNKLNNNLGWILGFRNINHTHMTLEYSIAASTGTLEAESICFIPHTKYFVIVIDDINKNQTNKGLVQIGNTKDFIKRSEPFKNSSVNTKCLTDSNFNQSIENNKNITKNQAYSELQINNYRTSFNNSHNHLNTNLINNVFAIVPFETKSLVWGETLFTSDKNKFQRKYSGPVNISKLQIKLLDDRGNIINLNGAEWSFSMISTHLYES